MKEAIVRSSFLVIFATCKNIMFSDFFGTRQWERWLEMKYLSSFILFILDDDILVERCKWGKAGYTET